MAADADVPTIATDDFAGNPQTRPVPVSPLVVTKGSKIEGSREWGMPEPVSLSTSVFERIAGQHAQL
jgi:hypothetical protein